MTRVRSVQVHLLPQLADPAAFQDGLAVVIDVLRATTTIIRALASGCECVRPCAEIDEAMALAQSLRAARHKILLGGERGGQPIPGFDLGNSPREYTPARCKQRTVILTTSNGTRALLAAQRAARVIAAGFVNFSAVCECLLAETRPIHILCAGSEGQISLEDTVLAGAFVDDLCEHAGEIELNDSARLAWDAFENHGRLIPDALALGAGGARLRQLGYDADIADAAKVDQFTIVPELRPDPPRLERVAVTVLHSHWPR